jgi:hypothetical protein
MGIMVGVVSPQLYKLDAEPTNWIIKVPVHYRYGRISDSLNNELTSLKRELLVR